MTSGAAEAVQPSSIPRRELLVLICLSLATMLGIGVILEGGTRTKWAEQEMNSCFERTAAGRRPRPNCTARIKNAEGPWVTMAYNGCGYRSVHPCGPKPAGTRRIAVMGTSIAEGLFVPYEQHFTARLERSLSARCGGPVEVQNTGSLEVPAIAQRWIVPEVLALKPDVVVMVYAPYDLLGFQRGPRAGPAARGLVTPASMTVTPAAAAAQAPPAPQQAATPSLMARLRTISRSSRALLVAQHFMLRSDDALYRAYELGKEDDVLRVPLSPKYQNHYSVFEAELGYLTNRFGAENVPVVVGGVPNRIQAALLSNGTELPGTDAAAYGRELQAMGERQGFLVADITTEFTKHPHAERFFYVVDGHPDGGANELIAAAVERTLTSGAVPAFAHCRAGS